MKPVIPAVKAVIIQGNSFLGLKKSGMEQEVYDLPGGKWNTVKRKGSVLYAKCLKKQG
ncbi:hypothetical protein ACSMFR_07165 [Listeria aquatica]|uniref:hypothetical protein n=1 Tax=Listeria aquatica TaxID=1494960 RepID=UPI003F71962B